MDFEILNLLRDFYNISGFRAAIMDINFNEVYSYPQELAPFCKFAQSLPGVRPQCLKSDANAFAVVKKTGRVHSYRCKCGLFEVVAPIYNFGRLTGYIMMGQVRDSEESSFKTAYDMLTSVGIEPSEAKSYVKTIPIIEPKLLNSYTNILNFLAEYVSQKIKLPSAENSLPILIIQEISKNYAQDITLPTLAKKFGCSVGTLTTAFKQEVGISIRQYLIKTRLEKSAELLKKSDKPIKEIAEDCGFYDQNHFYRAFKQYFSVSPTEYRNKKI